ncbi:MAG: septal ring lytic transglycosylase RlpA family protein [Nitrospirae bacterium]|nr:septal ring lytic transglycosylase RlpA family protein [Nitrospirota bacterium]
MGIDILDNMMFKFRIFINLNAISLAICAIALFLLSSCASTRYESYPESKYIIASWYGTDFHGKPTSSGEPFNMYARTCAHKEYPFGTKLRVMNTENSKVVECTVNDRGPFVAGRDLDLSYACAKEIELIGTGTGKVRIDYLGRDNRYIKYIKYFPTSSNGPFTIQVGSFKEQPNATRLKAALEFKYDRVYIIEAEIDGNTYFRVRIGKFYSKDEANSLAKILADEGYNILITQYDEKI